MQDLQVYDISGINFSQASDWVSEGQLVIYMNKKIMLYAQLLFEQYFLQIIWKINLRCILFDNHVTFYVVVHHLQTHKPKIFKALIQSTWWNTLKIKYNLNPLNLFCGTLEHFVDFVDVVMDFITFGCVFGLK